jgi:hypothetical protein
MKLDPQETCWDVAHCTLPSRNREEWLSLVNKVMNTQVLKIVVIFLFFDCLMSCWLLENDFARRSYLLRKEIKNAKEINS